MRFFAPTIVFIVLMLGLLIGLFNPQPLLCQWAPFDKYIHCTAFFSVSMAGCFAFTRLISRYYWLAWFCLGGLSEVLQGEVLPYRSFDYYDLAANLTGVAAALVVWFVVAPLFKK